VYLCERDRWSILLAFLRSKKICDGIWHFQKGASSFQKSFGEMFKILAILVEIMTVEKLIFPEIRV